tara:strand:- start:132 stop:386 length:255 start_codon:yes stop_codon:yes gene_type:complete
MNWPSNRSKAVEEVLPGESLSGFGKRIVGPCLEPKETRIHERQIAEFETRYDDLVEKDRAKEGSLILPNKGSDHQPRGENLYRY